MSARSAALSALLSLAGCAPVAPKTPPSSAAEILAEGRAEGLAIEDPLALDPGILVEAERGVPHTGHASYRMRATLAFLNDRGYLDFTHTLGRSLTAAEAYRERRGDCLSYTNLFVALSRRLGLDTYFVHVTDVRTYYERAGWFFVSSHVAVGHGSGPNTTVVDLTREISDWRLAYYERIDDGAALALHYNNVAVEAMVAGRADEAERLFRFFLARRSGVVELHNNLGVLLNRRGRYAEALAVLDRGIERFPGYAPLFTNAMRAAIGLGRADLAARYEQRGHAISRDDPYFLFARGLSLYERGEFRSAARAFSRAADVKPDSPVIHAWVARSHASAGDRREAARAFARARSLAPGARVVRDLAARWPDLASE